MLRIRKGMRTKPFECSKPSKRLSNRFRETEDAFIFHFSTDFGHERLAGLAGPARCSSTETGLQLALGFPGRQMIGHLRRAQDARRGTVEVDAVRERRLAKFRQNVARFRLYRLRFLQVNMRLKALAEIYTMHSFALL